MRIFQVSLAQVDDVLDEGEIVGRQALEGIEKALGIGGITVQIYPIGGGVHGRGQRGVISGRQGGVSLGHKGPWIAQKGVKNGRHGDIY